MSLFDDYQTEAQFAKDFPFDVPCEYWHSRQGKILVSEMTEEHILNCMNLVGEDDAWYQYFQKELNKRKYKMIEEKYINAKDFKRTLIDEKGFYPAIVARTLENMPSADVVKVVRCKDCRKRNTDDCWIAFYDEAGELYSDTQDNDYCARGEMKYGE